MMYFMGIYTKFPVTKLFVSEYVQTKIFHHFNSNDDMEYIPSFELILTMVAAVKITWAFLFKWTAAIITKIFWMILLKISCTLLIPFPWNMHFETWLNESNKDSNRLDGYNHVSLVRPDRIHGVISLFISAFSPTATLPKYGEPCTWV